MNFTEARVTPCLVILSFRRFTLFVEEKSYTSRFSIFKHFLIILNLFRIAVSFLCDEFFMRNENFFSICKKLIQHFRLFDLIGD